MTQNQEELSNDIATHSDDYYGSQLHHQILFLNYFINKFRQNPNPRSRELYAKSSRSGSPYSENDIVDETPTKKDYSASNADYSNDVDTHQHVEEKPNCEEVTCATPSSDPMGTYKTIRTPGNQVEQCLSITVAPGSRIQMTCTSINVSTGTYVTLLDMSGTSIIANPPIINVPYTTTDNTLIIKSLASSANADQLCCDWITV
ncbi:hypothetical protein GHT06_022798 [Daphnia sinensis]|uniref:Uncharacterized protein n=1 Tax=Daphnia sinensis TaxID=1820382 RepID=A0AAD5KHI0_9CRUS|nr:hypothetical protein GHT06_022798 [Daphnia sinensis]